MNLSNVSEEQKSYLQISDVRSAQAARSSNNIGNESSNQNEDKLYVNLIEQISMLSQNCLKLEEDNITLRSQLQSSKLFLNMVIHDMRSPTQAIKSGLQFAIEKLQKVTVLSDEKLKKSKVESLIDY